MDSQTSSMRPPDAVVLERARSFANEAMWAVALQRRRIRSTEPEDRRFVFRWWVDLQFLIVALRRLRRAAELASRVASAGPSVALALKKFDEALPQLSVMRNVGEHIDDYLLGNSKTRHKQVSRGMLQSGTWDGVTYTWLNESLNVDGAHDAAFQLFSALRTACRSAPAPAG
jgi:hypothetical protein